MSKPNATNGKARKILFGVLAIALAVLCFFAGYFTYSLTLDSEIRSLIQLKNTIQAEYYEQVSDKDFYDAVFDGVNENLLDPYSKYMTADEFAQTRSEAKGNRSGLGLVFLIEDTNGKSQMLVTRVCGNSPAESAGIKAGEYVVGFGKNQSQMQASVVFDEFSAFLETLATGELFYVRLQSGQTVRDVQIAKKEYVENYVFYRTNTTSYRFVGNKATTLVERGDPLSSLPQNTAYIRLTQFNGAAAEEFKQAMELFKEQGKTNLLLDLRENGGGFLSIMQSISSYFCKTSEEKKPVVAIADYGDKKESYRAYGNYYGEYFRKDSRICVLADSSTASASEALMGAMLDYGAISYGDICLSKRAGVAKTYGKGIMQSTFPFGLVNSDAVKLTTAKIVWGASQNCIHGRGILPSDGTLVVEEDHVGDSEINAAIRKLFL